jgi:hypothetical protein
MFKLISEISSTIEQRDYIFETVKEVFEGKEKELYEGAENYIGKAIGALNSGRNPFEQESQIVDPEVLASLVLLANPDNRDAFNITPRKFTVIDTVDKNENVRKFLSQTVGSSPSAQRERERLEKMAAENPKAVARELQKIQLLYTRAAGLQNQQVA